MKEFVKFGIVGLMAMLVHYLCYYILLSILTPNLAFSIGYVVSLVLNFILTSYYTFQVNPTFLKFVRFGLSHAINFVLQLSLLNLFLYLTISDKLAPIPVYLISVPVNFLLVRFAMKNKSLKKI